MTETGLLIAQIVFLVLLFAFIASIVRSAARQLTRVQPPPPAHGPVVDPPRAAPEPDPAPAPPPAPEPPWPDVAPRNDPPADPAPETVRQPTLEPFPSPLAAPVEPAPSGAAAVAHAIPETDGDEAGASSADEPSPGDETGVQDQADRDREAEPMTAATKVGAHAGDLTSGITPRLVVEASPALEAGSDLELEGGLTIGRSGAADLSLSDQYVSHMHARIVRRGPYYYVEDLGSTNGTFLNDLPVGTRAQLKVHDTLRMGQTVLRYEE